MSLTWSVTSQSDWEAGTLSDVMIRRGVGQIEIEPTFFFEGFADGDDTYSTLEAESWTGWSGDTGDLTIQTGTVIEGTYSGELASSNAVPDVYCQRDSSFTPNRAVYYIRPDTQSGNSSDRYIVSLESGLGPGSVATRQTLWHDGSFRHGSGSWSTDTVYKIEFYNIDFPNDEFDLRTTEDPFGAATVIHDLTDVAFTNSHSNVNVVRTYNDMRASGGSSNLYFDSFLVGDILSSGTYTSEWHDFGSEVSHDTLDVTSTLNSQTTNYTVRVSDDGGSTTLGSPVTGSLSGGTDNIDISGLTDARYVQVELNLSTTDVTASPEVQDYTVTSKGLQRGDDLLWRTTSGEWKSAWHNFGKTVSFQKFTATQTLNSQTITYQFRSSSDGTEGTASAFKNDITNVPNDQYLQVKANFSTTDSSVTPELHKFDVEARG